MSEMLFSVIIPTYSRPNELIRCVASIAACNFDRSRLEVIVVNDGGETIDEIARLPQFADFPLRTFSQPNRGPGAARNRGAAVARGRYLAFVDDDCIMPENWLELLEATVSRFPRRLVGGKTVNVLDDNAFSQASQSLVDYVYHYYNAEDTDRTRFFASNNLAVDGKMFAECGGFDESFRTAEDRDFCRMWKARGWGFHYAPEVVIRHSHHLTMRSLQRQHFNYGRGALPYWKKGAELNSARFKVEPLDFYSGMLLHPFSQRVPRPTTVAALIFLTQIANAAGFAYEAVRSMKRNRVAAPAGPKPAQI